MATESKLPETDLTFKTREAAFDYHVSRVIRSEDMRLEQQIRKFQRILDSFPEISPNRYLYGDISPFLLACNVKAYPLAAYIYEFLTGEERTMRNNSGSSIDESACVREIRKNMTQEQRSVVQQYVTEEREKRAAAEEEQRRAAAERAAAERVAAERAAEEARIQKERKRAEKQRRAAAERAAAEESARELVGDDGPEIDRRAAEIAGFEDIETTDARARAMVSNRKAIEQGRRRKSRKRRSTSRKSHTSL